MELSPYLNFNGNCAEAFTLYAQCLGGKIEMMQTHGDSPMAGQVAPGWNDKILHARMVFGDTALMASDAPPEMYEPPRGIYVSINVDTPEDADRIYGTLSDQGTVQMPIQETFWAARFAMFVDRFGTPWMINCAKPA
jgi:PhnB protein